MPATNGVCGCVRNEKTNSLSRCDMRLTSGCHLWRRTGRIFDASCCSAAWFFRSNEFDVGAFGTYAPGFGSGANAGKLRAWGGGMDSTYWFPWKYAGVRFQGDGSK